jgi:hypothetical protein
LLGANQAAFACAFCTGFLATRAAAFFAAFNFAHRIRWALAILFRAAADIPRFAFFVCFACCLAFNFAHLARWAVAILRRPAADILRCGPPLPADQVVDRALEWCEGLLALPRAAMEITHRQARADLMLEFSRDAVEELAEVPQKALRRRRKTRDEEEISRGLKKTCPGRIECRFSA